MISFGFIKHNTDRDRRKAIFVKNRGRKSLQMKKTMCFPSDVGDFHRETSCYDSILKNVQKKFAKKAAFLLIFSEKIQIKSV